MTQFTLLPWDPKSALRQYMSKVLYCIKLWQTIEGIHKYIQLDDEVENSNEVVVHDQEKEINVLKEKKKDLKTGLVMARVEFEQMELRRETMLGKM